MLLIRRPKTRFLSFSLVDFISIFQTDEELMGQAGQLHGAFHSGLGING